MRTKRSICLIIAIVLVTSMVPGAAAIHQVGPPEESGTGGGDVSSEIHAAHAEDDTGLDEADNPDPASTPSGQLILDGKYAAGAYPYFFDVNAVMRELSAGSPIPHEKRMYPGSAWLSAWWGWWHDKGSGESLNDHGPTDRPPLTGGPDEVINDGHDNHTTEQGQGNDTMYTGPWDEFVWRGVNPWAGQTAWDSQLGGKPSHDGSEKPRDTLLAFIHPGTHDNCCSGQDNQVGGGPFIGTGFAVGPFTVGASAPGLLLDNADNPDVPDIRLEDRTSQPASGPGGAPQNGAAYGWLSEFGWMHLQYDQSLLISTKVTYAANPTSSGPGTYDRLSGDATDVDVFSAVSPEVEDLYRMTVWDPGNDESSPVDDVVSHDEGAKEALKTLYTDQTNQLANDLPQRIDENVRPFNSALGPANDAQGKKPRPHEPNAANDTGYLAGFDEDTRYVASPNADTYYQPGGNPYDPDQPNGPQAGTQTYEGYQDNHGPWLDNQAQWAFPGYGVLIRIFFGMNAFTSPNSILSDTGDRSAAPGLLYFTANLGGWHDLDGDTFVGNLGEHGRFTSDESPYAHGRVDDPNDYTDTAQESKENPAKSLPAEWKGASCASNVEATVHPVGTPTNDDGEHAWGSTNPPVGVYYVEDADNDNFNPYDEMVGDLAPATGEDTDGERLSRHVQYGPIPITFECLSTGDTGGFLAQQNILLPTGSLDYQIRVNATGTIGNMPFPDPAPDLTNETVQDVDNLVPTLE